MIGISVDFRELRSDVVKLLEKQGFEIEICNLEAGDYIAYNRIAFKRITIDDILKSIFKEKRLFGQIEHLAGRYQSPVLIIEGEDPFFPGRTVNPGYIHGFLKKLAVYFRVPAIFTLNEMQTAELISSITRAEHESLTQPE